MDSMVIFRSFGKRALRIAAPRAFGHEVQFARGCRIFHPITRVLPDGPQSGRWSQSPWLKIISAAPLERRAGSDYERLLDFCVTL